MSQANRCAGCGGELAADAPQGLCPACLLRRGLDSQTGGQPSQPGDTAYVSPMPAELAPFFPDLEILGLIGSGGMGVVYQARQKHLDRLVALKILSPKIAGNAAFAERFGREARAMAMLSHPHIVAVYDFGESNGLYYFLMEYVDGLTLRQLLDAGKLSAAEALAIVPQICEALQYAHDKGVVHRDIKPENILLDKNGRVKIADFGLAKLLGRPAEEFALTGTGQVMGTPHYMAPEQLERPQDVDHRADIYSLGVVFYQMLTGELPLGRFAAPSKKVQIDVRLDEVVLRALEKEPELRYQQASEVQTAVETIGATAPATSGVTAPPSIPAVEPDGPPRISRLATLGAAWAPMFFVMVLLALLVTRPAMNAPGSKPPGMEWWEWLLALTVFPLGVAAPVATTLLGAVSISQIRHSAGRLYGLGLATFDALLFPLLLLDGLIAGGLYMLGEVLRHSRPPRDVEVLIVDALIVVTAVVVDVLLARWAWWAANRPVDAAPATAPSGARPPISTRRPSAGSPKPTPSSANGSTQVFAWIALGLFVVGLLVGPAISAVNPGAGITLAVAAELLALVFGILGRRHTAGRVAWIGVVGLFSLAAIAMAFRLMVAFGPSRSAPPVQSRALASPEPFQATFAATIHNAKRESLGQQGLNLRTGQLFDFPGGAKPNSPQARKQWIQVNGIDLLVGLDGKTSALMMIGGKLVAIDSEKWNDPWLMEEVRDVLASDDPGVKTAKEDDETAYLLPPEAEMPFTCIYQTRDGDIGFLRVDNILESPNPKEKPIGMHIVWRPADSSRAAVPHESLHVPGPRQHRAAEAPLAKDTLHKVFGEMLAEAVADQYKGKELPTELKSPTFPARLARDFGQIHPGLFDVSEKDLAAGHFDDAANVDQIARTVVRLKDLHVTLPALGESLVKQADAGSLHGTRLEFARRFLGALLEDAKAKVANLGAAGPPPAMPRLQPHKNGGYQITSRLTQVAQQPASRTSRAWPKPLPGLGFMAGRSRLAAPWQLTELKLVPQFGQSSFARATLAISPYGRFIYVVDADNVLHKITAEGLNDVVTLPLDSQCNGLSLCKAGVLAVLHSEGIIRVVDPDSLKVLRDVPAEGVWLAAGSPGADVGCVCFRGVAAGASPSPDRSLALIDFATGKYLHRVPYRSGEIRVDGHWVLENDLIAMQMSRDRKYLFLGGEYISRFRIDGGDLVFEESSAALRIGHTTHFVVSDDLKYAAMPAGGGNGSGYGVSYPIAVLDPMHLKDVKFVLANGAYPCAIGFDTKRGDIYSPNYQKMNIFDVRGNKQQEIPLEDSDIHRIFVSPLGGQFYAWGKTKIVVYRRTVKK